MTPRSGQFPRPRLKRKLIIVPPENSSASSPLGREYQHPTLWRVYDDTFPPRLRGETATLEEAEQLVRTRSAELS